MSALVQQDNEKAQLTDGCLYHKQAATYAML